MTVRRVRGTSDSSAEARSASIGRTRLPRRAGTIAAPKVTTTPTTMAITMPDVLMVRPPAGNARPNASNAAFNSAATPMPPNRPTTDASTPITSASTIVACNTCPRVAPIARMRADSRLRWATMIEKVL